MGLTRWWSFLLKVNQVRLLEENRVGVELR